MNIEDMQQRAAVETKIGSQAPAWLPMFPGNVVILAATHRKTRERSIPIVRAPQIAIASKQCFVAAPESVANVSRLIWPPHGRPVHDFLQSNAVCVKRCKHTSD